MSRLLAAGCSFTKYDYPTWADYIAPNFDSYTNEGIRGCDNSTIARIVTSLAKPHDTVIIMWTAYSRHSYGIENWKSEKQHWGGCNITDTYYFTNIFNQYERFLTSLDYLQWVIADSVIRKYNVIHLSAFPYILGEMHSPVTDTMIALIKEKQPFVDQINKDDLLTFASTYKKLDVQWVRNGQTFIDNHPTPLAHYDYANKLIKPLLGIEAMNISRSQALLDDSKVYRETITGKRYV